MLASNALIGLREGLEAALVVVILVAFLVKTDRRWALRYVWLGVGVAVGLSVLLGAILTFGTSRLSFEAQELVGGTASIIAVGFVTAMVFWMRSAARTISGELKGQLEKALDVGPWAVAARRLSRSRSRRAGDGDLLLRHDPGRRAGNVLPMLGWLVGLGGAAAARPGDLPWRAAHRPGPVLPLDRRPARLRGRRHPLLRRP